MWENEPLDRDRSPRRAGWDAPIGPPAAAPSGHPASLTIEGAEAMGAKAPKRGEAFPARTSTITGDRV